MQNSKYALKSQILPEVYLSTREFSRYYLSNYDSGSAVENHKTFSHVNNEPELQTKHSPTLITGVRIAVPGSRSQADTKDDS
jgi:hypothetical protein